MQEALVQTSSSLGVPPSAWTPADWATVAIAVAAVASFVTTAVFYRWTRRQRSPSPILVNAKIDRGGSPDRHPFFLKLRLSNPGDVPIYIVAVLTRVIGEKPRLAWMRKMFDVESKGIPTRDSLDVTCDVHKVDELDRVFPVGKMRRVKATLYYVSGGRLRKKRFGAVAGATRSSGDGFSWLPYRWARTWPLAYRLRLRISEALSKSRDRDQTQGD